jgi:hypothetical protein
LGGAILFSNSKSQVGRHGNINEWSNQDGRLANSEANGKNSKNIKTEFQGYRDLKDLKKPPYQPKIL